MPKRNRISCLVSFPNEQTTTGVVTQAMWRQIIGDLFFGQIDFAVNILTMIQNHR